MGSIRAELYYPIEKEVRGRNLGNHIGRVAFIQPKEGKQFLTEDRMATRERQLQTTPPFVLQSGGKHTIFTQRTHMQALLLFYYNQNGQAHGDVSQGTDRGTAAAVGWPHRVRRLSLSLHEA